MKRRNIFGITMGIIVVVCILMAMVQFKKDQANIAQKENVTELPGGITIRKLDDDEDYDISKNYYKDYDDTGLEKYEITKIFDYDSEAEYIKEVREANICEYIYKNEDGNIEVKVTEKQRKKWLKIAKNNINQVIERVKKDEESDFEIGDDYKELNVKVTKQCSAQEFLANVNAVTYNEEIMQVFSGEKDWSVHFVVQNMNTGYELVNIQFPQETWSITPDMWDE
ncbi:hypothetical protein [Roseburia sp. 831b]|uniref:hypothetical protein n=1 Tax=Roseburia sp. 831b TaxID=1261635 RepID=UPI0009518CD0|nr:hypothetical protein [Roseburia sp. 831b]WVK73204.1 hypothetical protein BIV16_01405 [Roseburia sp. 831b]